jgi:hypothetical protein
VRARVRDAVARGRAHFEAGRLPAAVAEMNDAMCLDPACEEAAEILWRVAKAAAARDSQAGTAMDPATEARVLALLALAASSAGHPPEEVRTALAELALIAPDDARVAEALREKAPRGR